ncbi:hypothetical protein RFI_07201 [Reticulomyxa filosa]|uniref:Uncharacterized protein n=1 Tax=Reticulomyxa filosa TaxID=46433 RepID=X6NVS4_RETFI|nr:hypothetical protein RFI_07201 [Reticulomyxa filosa]|eukprot:ETO29919.1 hypothetical protein RFI_07201 [Reticulomyxa filosa]
MKLPDTVNVSLAPDRICHCPYNHMHALCYEDPLMTHVLQLNYGMDFMTPKIGFKGPNEALAYEISNFMIPKDEQIRPVIDEVYFPLPLIKNDTLSKSKTFHARPATSNKRVDILFDILVVGGNAFMLIVLAYILVLFVAQNNFLVNQLKRTKYQILSSFDLFSKEPLIANLQLVSSLMFKTVSFLTERKTPIKCPHSVQKKNKKNCVFFVFKNGKKKEMNRIEVKITQEGKLEKWKVEDNQSIKKGDCIAIIERSDRQKCGVFAPTDGVIRCVSPLRSTATPFHVSKSTTIAHILPSTGLLQIQ